MHPVAPVTSAFIIPSFYLSGYIQRMFLSMMVHCWFWSTKQMGLRINQQTHCKKITAPDRNRGQDAVSQFECVAGQNGFDERETDDQDQRVLHVIYSGEVAACKRDHGLLKFLRTIDENVRPGIK